MTEYLTKEEVKQWRSSLEKITLEEFASRLGKKVEPPKSTHDIADIVLKGKPVQDVDGTYALRAEKLSSIARRAMEREQEITATPFSMKNLQKSLKVEKSPKKSDKKEKIIIEKPKKVKSEKVSKKSEVKRVEKAVKSVKKESKKTLREEVQIVFKKVLTEREQKVFDHFLANRGQIVYAKDLATLLDLPRDYVYKYIKNIRSKIEVGELQNAEQGGFLLKK